MFYCDQWGIQDFVIAFPRFITKQQDILNTKILAMKYLRPFSQF